ncbi:unnamed protein product, partial [marine sediment metagenome]
DEVGNTVPLAEHNHFDIYSLYIQGGFYGCR